MPADKEILLTFWLNIDVLGVLLLSELCETKRVAVLINVSKHVSILISSKPLVLPVKTKGLAIAEQTFLHVFVGHVTCVQYSRRSLLFTHLSVLRWCLLLG